ncbi:Sushi, von Willebrand factor type A, EGF and pentraxin domain-containing protein 1 [Holothuria leucospilota]|uniref:Sushi, von Willebrand factor type A, EGF and pentraxin domain-containing protein 1 n=1 Tax=Holothuria leucospilota TaxID=206669 RepID=A0A9Q1GYK8_HOLLE|nr:Sushi, von Willebrand factor type A, EGF and pentraxin domain-containing protein 1 [Holothuria leucospilota]
MYQVLWIVFVSALLSNQLDQSNCQTTCAPNQCPKSFFDDAFVISPDKLCYDINDQVSFTCSGKGGGPPSNTCKGNGGPLQGWELPPGTCEVFTCTGPVDENLILNPNKSVFEAREEVSFSCNEGYELTGPEKAVCDEQETWNPPTAPTCLVICYIPDLDHGTVTPTITIKVGDTAKVTCDVGFSVYPPSSSIMTCQADGTWDQEPACLEICNVAAVNHSQHTEAKDIEHTETLEIICDEGYSFNGKTKFEVTCEDGQLIGNLTDTCLASCTVAAVNNSNHIEDATILSGEEITINCNHGYSIDEIIEYNIRCEDGELFGKTTDTCYGDCEKLSPPPNGQVSDNYRHGTTATFSCSDGYSLNGTAEVTCENGNWNSVDVVVCYDTSITCNAPTSADVSLTIQPDKLSYNVNDTISYSCSNSKALKGPAEAVCSQDGEWDPPDLPVCRGNLARGVWLLTIASSLCMFLLH